MSQNSKKDFDEACANFKRLSFEVEILERQINADQHVIDNLAKIDGLCMHIEGDRSGSINMCDNLRSSMKSTLEARVKYANDQIFGLYVEMSRVMEPLIGFHTCPEVAGVADGE